MNRINLISIFSILLIFASFATSTPLKRQDQLTGFKQCQGTFPNSITVLTYTPNPVVLGQNVTVHIAGKATEVIKQGTTLVYTGYFENEPTKQAFQHQVDFCDTFVKPNGSECPVKEGDYSFIGSWLLEKHPNEPQNLVMEFGFNISVFDPNGKILSCLDGPMKVYYP
ncbi:hypothetical protein RclHR1_00140042 [Rhizophagus clarus]|uniref:Phosphatidylglycerol/phosphatidylinositol transfer protein n=1 Tax=Rhizophagus clarus TaxID=94130 RepID=A0A2Z6R437_9GLOM|nr:hypothetical protein RclHR1_00140042 [Rhizophagus clarus]GES83542.1 hypothetical protein GLOIN_2v573312 [Rhizophagus clarus]